MPEYTSVNEHWSEILSEQASSISVTRFRDLSIDDDIEKWTDRVLVYMPTTKSLLNRDLLADNMILVGEEGLQSIIAEADAQGQSYNSGDISSAREYARLYTEDRIDALLGDTPNGSEITSDIRNPWLENGVDVATALAIAYMLRKSLRGNEGNDSGWSEAYLVGIGIMISARAAMLAFDGLARTFGNAIIGFISRFGLVWKTWLETTSKVPRDDHLAVVGETVRYDDSFSHGQFWSQESYNCKCGIQVTFGREP